MDRVDISDIIDTAFKRGLRLLSGEYKNNSTKMDFVDKNGYKYSLTYQNLKISRGKFGRFSKCNPHTIYNIKIWLSLNSNSLKLISDVYTNMNDKNIIIECICGKIYNVSLCNLVSRKSGCPNCKKKRGLKYTTDEIAKLIDNNINILNEYTGIKKRAICECRKCNHKWETSFDALLNNKTGCPKCFNDKRGGETSSTWKGGITPLYSNIRGFMLPWKIDSYKKYDHKCDITGIKLNSNIIHHHYNYSDILKETLKELDINSKGEISNYTQQELKLIKEKCLELHYKYGLGICLTKELHNEFHNVYGKRNNTLEQYLEFKENKLKEMEVTVNER